MGHVREFEEVVVRPYSDDEVDPTDGRALSPDEDRRVEMDEELDPGDDRDLEDDDLDDLDDDDDFDDDDEDYDDLDELEDASDDEIDCVVALYADDGERTAVPMDSELANDLDELMTQLRRLPGDAGAVALVSIDHQFFVIVRVRGRNVQVFLSDGVQANDWPIARDVADYLGEDIPDPDDDPEPMGDFDLLADVGLGEFDLEAITELDEDSDEQLATVARRINFGTQFERAAHTSVR